MAAAAAAAVGRSPVAGEAAASTTDIRFDSFEIFIEYLRSHTSIKINPDKNLVIGGLSTEQLFAIDQENENFLSIFNSSLPCREYELIGEGLDCFTTTTVDYSRDSFMLINNSSKPIVISIQSVVCEACIDELVNTLLKKSHTDPSRATVEFNRDRVVILTDLSEAAIYQYSTATGTSSGDTESIEIIKQIWKKSSSLLNKSRYDLIIKTTNTEDARAPFDLSLEKRAAAFYPPKGCRITASLSLSRMQEFTLGEIRDALTSNRKIEIHTGYTLIINRCPIELVASVDLITETEFFTHLIGPDFNLSGKYGNVDISPNMGARMIFVTNTHRDPLIIHVTPKPWSLEVKDMLKIFTMHEPKFELTLEKGKPVEFKIDEANHAWFLALLNGRAPQDKDFEQLIKKESERGIDVRPQQLVCGPSMGKFNYNYSDDKRILTLTPEPGHALSFCAQRPKAYAAASGGAGGGAAAALSRS